MRTFNPTPTYTAFYQDNHREIIYRRREDDGNLTPPSSTPIDDARSTYFRTDGGDRFAFAWFSLNGRTIIIQRDGVPPVSS